MCGVEELRWYQKLWWRITRVFHKHHFGVLSNSPDKLVMACYSCPKTIEFDEGIHICEHNWEIVEDKDVWLKLQCNNCGNTIKIAKNDDKKPIMVIS